MAEQEKGLVEEIMADARRRADRIRQRAEREAGQITAEAQKSAQDERERVLEAARAPVQREREVMHARIEQEVVELRHRLRHQMVEHVRSQAREKLAQLAGTEEHRRAVVKLAVLAIRAMSGRKFRLVLRPDERDRWGSELAVQVQSAVRQQSSRQVEVEIAEETTDAPGGLLVIGAGGHEVADQTFDGRLGRLWDQMRIEIGLNLPDVSGTGE